MLFAESCAARVATARNAPRLLRASVTVTAPRCAGVTTPVTRSARVVRRTFTVIRLPALRIACGGSVNDRGCVKSPMFAVVSSDAATRQ